MKKIIVLLLSLFLISSCSSRIKIDEKNHTEVLYDVIEQKIKDKETFVFYLGSDKCSSCDEYSKSLKNYFDKNNEDVIYYVDVFDNFSKGQKYEHERTKLANICYELYGKDFNYENDALYTPTTFKVIDGEFVFSIVGAIKEAKIEDIFNMTSNNIVKTELNYDQTIELLNSEEDYYFYFTQDGCPNCFSFNLQLNSFTKQESEVVFNYMKFTNDIVRDNEKFNTIKKILFDLTSEDEKTTLEEFDVNVPTIIKQKNKVKTMYVGNPTFKELTEILV